MTSASRAILLHFLHKLAQHAFEPGYVLMDMACFQWPNAFSAKYIVFAFGRDLPDLS